ncbi:MULTISPECIES: SusE domain-containing protein [unclassified Mucilaginibacter]|uniref:SusE domain-containing protein n=1 Tax=unclassified Mucilaginibacter TaxID=2617802 RepID=UPI002AC8FF1C|nr:MULTISPECIES: SusE domain-containing protein [unclassified Mucilaginibacter]MEB0262104.1 SusE domain-containing protein [Mucilaginibacter sp. 10I4]MEB0278786.1 SusE domain-containing protein [Mucilaginibacter sp. 10B2]MEB0299849.1 SusE domain-containing protein [Mucilaginibacter sp. 5C4]WPX21969.1 SusE domain-containing protein [Mucilaginibacter sp. 5C4]
MKNIFYSLLAGIVALVVITGCKKDKTLANANVSPVTNLFLPEDGKFVKIATGASGSVAFEWEQARAEDNGVVLYEVAFDKEGGDFSKPLYSIPSDGNGLYNKLTLNFSDLNKIAALGGVKQKESGKFIWTVMSSRGINLQKTDVKRVIEIQRPDGFESPNAAYLTGTATEGGDDLSKALKMKKTTDGKFEIYTSLKAGEYRIVDGTSGTINTFSYDGSKLVEGGQTTVTGNKKIMRIQVGFTDALVTTTEVTSVGLWFSADNKIWFDLPYTSNGTWESGVQPIVFHQETWGRDERYKFRFTFKNADGSSTTQFYGSANSDNNAATSATAASYFYMLPVNNSQYDFAFKFNHDFDNKSANIRVMFNATVPAYTHSVTTN